MAERHATLSTWAPLRVTVFRWLWLASLASNVGTWMQTVGAQWFLVHAAHAAILVSLVQTADMLPDVMFGIVGGVLADTLDRRRLLMAVQAALVVATSGLAALTIAGDMTPALLLMFTFVIGTGSVLTNPCLPVARARACPARSDSRRRTAELHQRQPRQGDRTCSGRNPDRIRSGSGRCLRSTLRRFSSMALWSLSGGPARISHRKSPSRSYRHFEPAAATSAMPRSSAGYCFGPHSFLSRRALFGRSCPSSPANRLGLGSSGYGLLLGALGVGAIAGASVLSKVRARLSPNALIGLVGGVFAAPSPQ